MNSQLGRRRRVDREWERIKAKLARERRIEALLVAVLNALAQADIDPAAKCRAAGALARMRDDEGVQLSETVERSGGLLHLDEVRALLAEYGGHVPKM